MPYLNFSDILRRTVYTKRGLLKMAARPEFPAPAFMVGEGKIRIWHLADIEAFEKAHPELTSNVEKWRKVTAYQRARAKGKHGGGEGI